MNAQPNDRSLRTEAISLSVLLAAFLLINLATSAEVPTVYQDEVQLTDPAANLYLGNGFTSSAWSTQTKDTFWAGHGPLYSILLYCWMVLFGFGVVAVRSLNYVLMVGSGLMLWVSVRRLNLVPSAGNRVALIALLLLSYGLTFNYRTGRLDCTAIALLAASGLAYSVQCTRMRCLLFSAIGILLPMAGPQVVAYASMCCALLLLYLGKSVVKVTVSLAIGLVLGISFLYLLYTFNGVVDNFIDSLVSRSPMSKGLISKFAPHKLSDDISVAFPFILAKDISFPFLLASALTLAVYQARKARLSFYSPLSFGLTLAVSVPLAMFLLVHYPAYYSWMAFIPLAICVFSELSKIDRSCWTHGLIRVAIGLLVVAGAIGLPLHLTLATYDWHDRDYTVVEDLVKRNVTATDWVYCDYGAYYAAKKRAAGVILPRYLHVIRPHEKEKISVLIIDSRGLEEVQRKLGGGQWFDCGDGLKPEIEGLFGLRVNIGLLTLPKYNLRVFRRSVSCLQQ